MRLIHASCESSSVRECLDLLKRRFEAELTNGSGTAVSAKIALEFGAFMNASVTVLLDEGEPVAGLIADYTSERSREHAIADLIARINSAIRDVDVVGFELGTYTTPVTRRTYAVGIVVYNRRIESMDLGELETERRRELLASVLRTFNYNVRVLNISELARVFGVSRDTIYYDVETILKRRR